MLFCYSRGRLEVELLEVLAILGKDCTVGLLSGAQGSRTRFPGIRRRGLILNATEKTTAQEGIMLVGTRRDSPVKNATPSTTFENDLLGFGKIAIEACRNSPHVAGALPRVECGSQGHGCSGQSAFCIHIEWAFGDILHIWAQRDNWRSCLLLQQLESNHQNLAIWNDLIHRSRVALRMRQSCALRPLYYFLRLPDGLTT